MSIFWSKKRPGVHAPEQLEELVRSMEATFYSIMKVHFLLLNHWKDWLRMLEEVKRGYPEPL